MIDQLRSELLKLRTTQTTAMLLLAAAALTLLGALIEGLSPVGRYLPGKAGDALAGLPDEHLVAPGLGGVVVVAWTFAFVAVATARNDRSDV